MRQPLEKFGCAALLEFRRPVYNKVFLEAGRANLGALEREYNTWIATNVAQLLLLEQVSRDQLIAVEPDPDTGHLW